MDMGAGKVRINGKFVQFIDIKEAYEMPQEELESFMDKRGDGVHYGRNFMKGIVDCAINRIDH